MIVMLEHHSADVVKHAHLDLGGVLVISVLSVCKPAMRCMLLC